MLRKLACSERVEPGGYSSVLLGVLKLPQMQELYATERLYMPDNRPVASNDTKTMNCGANETLSFTCCTLVAPTPRYRPYRFSDLLVEELLQAFRGLQIVRKRCATFRLR